ncbi:putative inositol phospholipid biosynthesis protein Scs3 [Aspergillus saccharolyticus JOP 1030-1]|uniref:Acyl-coenzyme A diphosphatase SCS3 n=1 Tax=Aspergillus saccharolyticus JOP 1030-1 TaxID=1450539 RepID=A0A318ZHP0_9EURO|nr:hypothetical protein BP01DRAFT_393561 [Aspergillus saccharolyticus JOP 1030-1]PYH43210.1 hypothetical protein BP01DRAFT_393561 [Aspergillus saccharolyticus JOP 1030-1]
MPTPDNPPPSSAGVTATTRTTSRPQQPPITFLLVYPLTLLVGSLFSVLSPTAYGTRASSSSSSPLQNHPSPLAPTIASDLHFTFPPAKPVNYFARKDNLFNLYFVKVGWLWTTLAFVLLLLTQPAYTGGRHSSRSSSVGVSGAATHRSRRTTQAIIRYALATTVWYFTTQWFFGPAIIDRSFVLTGGKCERAVPQAEDPYTTTDLGTLATAVACKSAGGAWRGGHDVSGHVFLLVLMTSLVGFEVWGGQCGGDGGLGKKEDVVVEGEREREKEKQKGLEGAEAESAEDDGLGVWSVRLASMVMGLGMWMLLMTAIWFHTWFEKLTGLMIALATVYTIYLLPRRVASWREIVGLPGV